MRRPSNQITRAARVPEYLQFVHFLFSLVYDVLQVLTLSVLSALEQHIHDAGYRCYSGLNDHRERL